MWSQVLVFAKTPRKGQGEYSPLAFTLSKKNQINYTIQMNLIIKNKKVFDIIILWYIYHDHMYNSSKYGLSTVTFPFWLLSCGCHCLFTHVQKMYKYN